MSRYKTPRPYFHTFEGDDAQIGLNFADEKEADTFQQTIEGKLAERRARRERKTSSKSKAGGQTNGSRPPTGGEVKVSTAYTSTAPPFRKESASAKKGEKKKLKKEDIGMPTNFQHISHVGWDPNRGFDLENVDPNLKKFFQKAGVDERALQDKDTREFIYDFIDKHGGVEAALREVNSLQENFAPPPPPRVISQPSSAVQRATANNVPMHAPPPPPPNHPVSRSASSAVRSPPPAPPSAPPQSAPAPPPPPPPPPPMAAAAPPPPPSGPPPPPGAAPPPPAPPALPPVPESHTNLMEEIRKGGTLRHVSPEKLPRPEDSRSGLLGQIRQGVTLKRVEPADHASAAVDTAAEGSGIAGMLQRALQERGMVMGLSSSDESECDDEDDEWD